MTISNTTVEQIYQGDGSEDTFAVPFVLQNNSEIEVTLRDETDPDAPVITAQVLTTHYTLTGGPPATNVVMNTAPGAAVKVLIRRVTPKTQTADYIANGPFPAEQHESTLDKIVQQVQELSNALRRVPSLNKTVPLTDISPALPQPIATGIWAWDVDGENIEFIDPTTLLGVLGGFSDPMTSRGDIIIRNASNNTDRLAVGTSGQVLMSDGSDISWDDLPTGFVTSLAAFGSTPTANGLTVTAGALNMQPADATNPGGVSTLAQTFAGAKTFSSAMVASSTLTVSSTLAANGNLNAALAVALAQATADSATTGSDADMPLPACTGIRLTNTSLASVRNIAAGATGRILVIVNDSTGAITIKNNAGGTAADRIITGTGADLNLANGAALFLYYDGQSSRWRIIGGSGGGGGGGSGDVVGPASATDNALAVFDGATGKLLQDSVIVVDPAVGDMTTAGDITAAFFIGDGSLLTNLPAGFADPMTTRGDIIVRNSSNTTARLAVGAAGRHLRSDGTDISWAQVALATDVSGVLPLANGGSAKALTAVAGGIVYTDADSMEILAAGNAGEVLQSNGASPPSWVAVSSTTPTQFGTRGTPRSIVAATGITTGASHMSNSAVSQDIYVEGSTGAESVCATISVGTVVGQVMTIIGRNNSQLLTLDDTTTNVELNGSITLGVGQNIQLKWDGTAWYEISRRA